MKHATADKSDIISIIPRLICAYLYKNDFYTKKCLRVLYDI